MDAWWMHGMEFEMHGFEFPRDAWYWTVKCVRYLLLTHQLSTVVHCVMTLVVHQDKFSLDIAVFEWTLPV